MTDDERNIGERLVRFETVLRGTADDISAMRAAQEKQAEAFDRRVSHLELGVRALEDREVRRAALEQERARVAKEAAAALVLREEELAEQRREENRQHFTRAQGMVSTAVIAVVTILAALIASGKIF